MRIIFIILFISLYISIFGQTEQLSLPIKHNSYVTHLIFSTDRRYVYTVSKDQTIKLWYFSSGNLVKTFIGHTNTIKAIAIDNTNSFLFSADEGGNVFVWNTLTGDIIKRITASASVETILWCENNKNLIVSTSDGKLTWYQYPQMNIIETISTSPFIAIKILKAKDPNFYFVGFKKCNTCKQNILQNGNVQLFDASTHSFFPLCNYTDDLSNLILSPDSSKLVSASSENYMIRVWDTNRLLEETSIKTPTKPYTLFVSRTNKMIGVGSAENGELRIYRYSGEEILSTIIDTGYVVYGEINNDITRIHLLNNYGQFKKYDFSFNLREVMGYYTSIINEINTIAYNKENQLIIMGLKNGMTKIFDLKTTTYKNLPFKFKASVSYISTYQSYIAIVYDPIITYNETDNPNLANNTESVAIIYDIQKDSIIKKFNYSSSYITSIFVASEHLFLGFNNGKIEIWNIKVNKKINEIQASPYDILQLYYSPHQQTLYSKDIDNRILVFQLKPSNQIIFSNTINLNEQEELYSFLNNQYATNQKINFQEKNFQYANNGAHFINKDTCIIIQNNTIKAITFNNNIIWEIIPEWTKPLFVLSDSTLHRIFVCDKHGNIAFYNSIDGKWICNLYVNQNDTWICKSEQHYDIEKSLINKVFTIKGISFVDSNPLKHQRIEQLLQKLVLIKE
ncbi:MAG: hypothetical protein HPY79_03635 [Bacteroidales bacterium]|nr:hypothetical protein [Bacteroidales bacterium]